VKRKKITQGEIIKMIIREIKTNILKGYYNFRIGINEKIYNLLGNQNDNYSEKIWAAAEGKISDDEGWNVKVNNITTRILLKDKNKILKNKLEAIA
jgi:hypothetical protein